jgi:hypothetical protein
MNNKNLRRAAKEQINDMILLKIIGRFIKRKLKPLCHCADIAIQLIYFSA